jgi:hypothetical protein
MNRLRLLLFTLLALGAVGWFPVTAQTNAPAAGERILLIVETSEAMQARASNVWKVVGSVIAGGLDGDLIPGSTVGLWTFNETLFTRHVAVQTWTEASRQNVAQTLVQILRQQRNEKLPRPAAAWEAATNVAARSSHFTVLLVSSGSEPITGTPFDDTIAETFAKNFQEQRRNNMPFLTILRAVRGEFVAATVNMPPWPLEVPAYPAGLEPGPSTAPAPSIATNSPPPVLTRADPGVLSPTNVVRLTPPAPAVASSGAVVTPAETNPPIAQAPEPGPAPAVVVREPAGPTLPPVPPEEPAADEAAVAEARAPASRRVLFWVVVACGLLIAGRLVWQLTRRPARPSLITESLNDRPK